MLPEAKRSTTIKMVSAMSVHSASGHDSCPVELTCCEVTIGKSQFKTYLHHVKETTKRTCNWS